MEVFPMEQPSKQAVIEQLLRAIKGWLLIGLFTLVPLTVHADKSAPLTFKDAERISMAAFKKATGNKIKKYEVRLYAEDAREWKFAFEKLNGRNGPGDDLIVLVSKATGRAQVIFGM